MRQYLSLAYLLIVILLTPAAKAKEPDKKPPQKPAATYNHLFDIRNIEGWTVYIAPDLQAERAFADRILKLLDHKLHLIQRYIPEKALPQLHKVPHPALINPQTFFAEITESYYGFNDHYPFIQFELSQLDPDVCKLLARLWGGKAK